MLMTILEMVFCVDLFALFVAAWWNNDMAAAREYFIGASILVCFLGESFRTKRTGYKMKTLGTAKYKPSREAERNNSEAL